MIRTATHSTLAYRLLTWLLFPAALVYSGLTALKYQSLQYFLQRLGIFQGKIHTHNHPVWCHCASIGEINTALPLLQTLAEYDLYLLVSTNTISGRRRLQNLNLNKLTPVYLPLDYIPFVKRFLSTFSPVAGLIFETELWPNLLLTSINRSIPIAVINGRISDKTLRAPAFVRRNYQTILTGAHAILASSAENSARFVMLGANKQTITTPGNLKFATPGKADRNTAECVITYRFLLCASTHADEEEKIIQAWRRHGPRQLGLILAMRHPQRKKQVCRMLKKNNCAYCLHSDQPARTAKNTVYLIDTLGELLPFMKKAELIFMGGSLVPVGGHNLLEAAQFAKCILTGPCHANIKEITDELIDCNGIRIVKDANELVQCVNQLLKSPQLINQIGANAKNYLASKQHILKTYQQQVLNIIRR